MAKMCVLMLFLMALGAAAFEVPPVKMRPKSQIPADHVGRILSWEGVDNARDLGGVKTLDGRRVKRGLVYRSQAFNDNAVCTWMTAERMERKLRNGEFRSDFGEACLQRMLARIGTNDLSKSCAAIAAEVASGTNKWEKGSSRGTAESRAKILRETGLRTEIDLRSKEETWGMEGSPLGPQVRWINIPGVHMTVLPRSQGKQMFAKCFRIFLDRSNYPIDFHCIAGADRTGSLAYILNALLGVDEDELWKDWEVTAFDKAKLEFGHASRFEKLVAVFAKYPGATERERVEAYVKEQGFTDADLAKFRAIMLEPK